MVFPKKVYSLGSSFIKNNGWVTFSERVLLAMQVNPSLFVCLFWSGNLVSERKLQARLIGQKLVLKDTLRKQNIKPYRKKERARAKNGGRFQLIRRIWITG